MHLRVTSHVSCNLSWTERPVTWLETVCNTHASSNEILPETDQSLALSLGSTSNISHVGWSYFLYRLPLHSWLNFIKMPERTSSWKGNSCQALVWTAAHSAEPLSAVDPIAIIAVTHYTNPLSSPCPLPLRTPWMGPPLSPPTLRHSEWYQY
jgi:hypothetical protein